MPHWYSEHQGRRSRGSEPQQSRSPSVSIPAPASARDDDSGRQHTVISKGEKMTKTAAPALVISTAAGQPPIGKPLIVQARGQLRLTWKLYAESPQSGEISLPDVTQNIGAGDLSALRHNRAEVPLLPYRPLPPPEMTHWQTGSPKKVIKKAVRNGYAFLHSLFLSIEKSSPRRRAFSVLQASAAFAFLVRKY